MAESANDGMLLGIGERVVFCDKEQMPSPKLLAVTV